MIEMNIIAATLVDDVMRRWPDTIRAFLDHRMNCPNGHIACFHTAAEACCEHQVEAEIFLRDQRLYATSAA